MGFFSLTISINANIQNEQRNKVMAIWLFVIAAMVFAMVVIGGLTRLTHSGLSMVDWRPFSQLFFACGGFHVCPD